jgi:hypothetical protein
MLLSFPPRRRHSRPAHQVYSSMVRMNADGYPVNEPEPTEPPRMLILPHAPSRSRYEDEPSARAARVWYHMQRIASGQ